ncbi:uncharacterized protein AAGF69_015339 [Amazona ochrocephala]
MLKGFVSRALNCLLQDKGKRLRTMGSSLIKEQRNVLQVFADILKKYGKRVDEEELKRILLWASKVNPSINSTHIYTPVFWDKIGVSLLDCATKNDKVATNLLSLWRIIFETLKVYVGSQANEAEAAPLAPFKPPFLPYSTVRSRKQSAVAAPAVLLPDNSDDDLDGPFDPRPIDPEKGPDLYPPDPHDKWAAVRGEARRAGDADVLHAFPVVYVPDQDLRWESLSYAFIKDIRQTVMDHGLGAPYTTHLIQSLCDTHVFTPNDFKTFFCLIMMDMQYTMWESKMRHLAGTQATENLVLGARDPLRAVTGDALLGQADFGTNTAQARICQVGLQQVKQLALCALKPVPEAGKQRQPFV